MKLLYNNKKRPGNWAALESGKSEVYWIWHIRLNLKYNQWSAVLKTPIFHFSKDNTSWTIGFDFGKWFAGFIYHW